MKGKSNTLVPQPGILKDEIVTVQHLEAFRVKLLNEIKKLLPEVQPKQGRVWLKSSEVSKLLKVSSTTLFNLRESGTLPCTKINGVFYYDRDEIEKMLAHNPYKVDQQQRPPNQ